MPTSPKPQWPTDLMRRNREVLAERLDWPDGALHACLDLERRYPGWHVDWRGPNLRKGFERPAGFHAEYKVGRHHAQAFDPDPEALAGRMAIGVPEHDYSLGGCAWCYAHPGRVAKY